MPVPIAPGPKRDCPAQFLMPVLLVLTVLATQEVLRLAAGGGHPPGGMDDLCRQSAAGGCPMAAGVNLYLLPGRAGSEFVTLAYFEFFLAGSRSPLWAMAIGVLMIFVGEMRRYEQPGGTLAKIAVGVFSLVYVGLMFTFAVQIRLFWGVGAIAAWIISVKMGDIGAYTVGRLFGRNKMSPTISPGKTVEGAVGALVFALIGSWISFHGTFPGWRSNHLPGSCNWRRPMSKGCRAGRPAGSSSAC